MKIFVLKYKFTLLIFCLLILSATSWEFYSLHSYRSGLYAATVAQLEGDFEEANNKLQEVKAVTKRSIVLFITRSKSVEGRIGANNEWRKTAKNNQETSEDESKESSNFIQENESFDPTQENTSPNMVKENTIDNTWRVDLPVLPDWETYQNLPKNNTKTYLCTDEEITKMQNRRYQIADDIWKMELAKFNDKKNCYNSMQVQRDLCIEQSCQVRMEVYWACIEATCGQYSTQTCDNIYNSPSHNYNVTLSSLNGELSRLNKSLEICWADRLQ
jgi:hypothetical protein